MNTKTIFYLFTHFIATHMLLVNRAVALDEDVTVYLKTLDVLDSKSSTWEQKFDAVFEYRIAKEKANKGNDLQFVAQELARAWLGQALREASEKKPLSQGLVARFNQLVEPVEEKDTGLASFLYSQCLCCYVNSEIIRNPAMKRKPLSADWSFHLSLMRTAIKHQAFAKKYGVEGIFREPLLTQRYDAVTGLYQEIRKLDEASQRVKESVASSSSSREPPSVPAASTNTPKETTSVTKTFTVTSDARANQTGNEAGASGESLITVRGDGGAFTVRYWYDWPSSYLISAARDKTLVGKSVTIEFDGDKAKYISCGAGSGKCQVKSFSR